VASGDGADRAVSEVAEALGAPRILVNCAGIAAGMRTVGRDGPHPLDLFRKVIEVNLIGTFNMIRLFASRAEKLDPLQGGERGVIVCTASVAAFDGQIGQAAYSASKAGVAGMTLPVARDLSRAGIRVMTIAPGIFRTPMMAGMPQEVQDSLGAAVPFPPRLGEPSEYAALALHIVQNQMLNGETIRLDGAIRMAPK
jgi:NAD(P)-dependent dehydrogenase (short-subunit alcohol dehydrogenase family)